MKIYQSFARFYRLKMFAEEAITWRSFKFYKVFPECGCNAQLLILLPANLFCVNYIPWSSEYAFFERYEEKKRPYFAWDEVVSRTGSLAGYSTIHEKSPMCNNDQSVRKSAIKRFTTKCF